MALRRRAAGKRDGVLPVRGASWGGQKVPFDQANVVCPVHDEPEARFSCARAPFRQPAALLAPIQGLRLMRYVLFPCRTCRTQGETVPYVICVERQQQQQDGGAAAPEGGAAGEGGAKGPSASGSLAERARHPEELRENSSLAVDVEYYLTQQVCVSSAA